MTTNNAVNNNTDANFNIKVGTDALDSITTGSDNVAVGHFALQLNVTNSGSIAIGTQALQNSQANQNIAIGYQSMVANTIGTFNTAVGTLALNANTSGIENTAVGYQALWVNTIGVNNSAFGVGALFSNITGGNNTAVGQTTLFNAESSGNTGCGALALRSTTSGGSNSAFGEACMEGNTTGVQNVGYGALALLSNVGGSSNVAIGTNCLEFVIGGSNNIGMGYTTGSAYTSSESSNIVISNTGTIGESNVIRIGTQGAGSGQQNACYIAGIAGNTSTTPSVATIDTSTNQLGNDTTNFTILSTGLQLKGNNTGTAPPVGTIGERIVSAVTGVGMSTGTPANVTRIDLTAGIWDISGLVQISGSGSFVSDLKMAISVNSASYTGTSPGDSSLEIHNSGLTTILSLSIPAFNTVLSTTTTYYLVSTATFISGTTTASGRISATRVG